jgi:hypothetical protein
VQTIVHVILGWLAQFVITTVIAGLLGLFSGVSAVGDPLGS